MSHESQFNLIFSWVLLSMKSNIQFGWKLKAFAKQIKNNKSSAILFDLHTSSSHWKIFSTLFRFVAVPIKWLNFILLANEGNEKLFWPFEKYFTISLICNKNVRVGVSIQFSGRIILGWLSSSQFFNFQISICHRIFTEEFTLNHRNDNNDENAKEKNNKKPKQTIYKA